MAVGKKNVAARYRHLLDSGNRQSNTADGADFCWVFVEEWTAIQKALLSARLGNIQVNQTQKQGFINYK